MQRRSAFIALCLGLSALLTACGGGGASLAKLAAQEAPRATFNAEAAFNNAITDNSTLAFTVEGTSNGVPVSGRGQYEQSMLETVSEFDARGGALRKLTPVKMTLDVNQRQVNVESTAADYYTRQGLQLLGREALSPQREFVEVTSYQGLPSDAQVGSNGVLYSAKRYSDAARRQLNGTTLATYSLEPDSAAETALLVIKVADLRANGEVANTTTTVYRITQSGTARRVSETTTDAATQSSLRASFG